MSWGSKIESKDANVSGTSDLKNMSNMVAEKTSYVDSNDFKADNMVDNMTSKKTQMRTYALRQLPKKPSFNVMNDVNNVLELLSPKFQGSNQLPSAKSCVLEKMSFEPVKSFALDIELLVVLGKNQKALVEFESPEVASLVASKWFVLMGKNSVWMVLAHKALLYTLPVGTTVHDLSGLLDLYGKKTCFIGHNPSSYVCNRCAVVCFTDKESKLAVISSNPVFKNVNLRWTGLSLAYCAKYKQIGHISDVCSSGEISGACGKRVKKQAPIACSVSFDSRTWAQIAGSLFFHVASSVLFGASLFLVAKTSLFASALSDDRDMYDCLASLEHSLKLLADQISGILEKLGSIKLVSLATTSDASLSAVSVSVVSGLNLDIVLDGALMIPNFSSPVIGDTTLIISSSNSKVLTTKVSSLESKMVALEISVEFVLEKLDCLCSDLGLSAASIS
ncbi:hypothetical protein G9A89_000644 [Geosiphon pyriformis]|nr:hypothetical protein G9A89_000644 [Geosiphon pyriformis]